MELLKVISIPSGYMYFADISIVNYGCVRLMHMCTRAAEQGGLGGL